MVGILALQGDFSKHRSVLDAIKVESIYVKNKSDLEKTRALIIPGGESTTLSKLIDRFSLRDALVKYSENFSIMGTCAGMIILSSSAGSLDKSRVKVLNIMDFSIRRNAWGSQIDSFEKKISLKEFGINNINAIFIRAPKVKDIGRRIVKVGFFDDNPVIIEDNRHLVMSFHPELDNDSRLYRYFLNKSYYGT